MNYHQHQASNEDPIKQAKINRALTEGVALNNAAFALQQQGKYSDAVKKFRQAVDIKIDAYGLNSIHVCISLSGLADCMQLAGDIPPEGINKRASCWISRRISNHLSK